MATNIIYKKREKFPVWRTAINTHYLKTTAWQDTLNHICDLSVKAGVWGVTQGWCQDKGNCTCALCNHNPKSALSQREAYISRKVQGSLAASSLHYEWQLCLIVRTENVLQDGIARGARINQVKEHKCSSLCTAFYRHTMKRNTLIWKINTNEWLLLTSVVLEQSIENLNTQSLASGQAYSCWFTWR